jgi:plasmid maintenance system killer protein
MLSLRGMSIFVLLIDKKNFRLVSLEKFLVDQRLRHFGLNFQNRMYQKNNFFYISVDGEGLYEMKFNNFR